MQPAPTGNSILDCITSSERDLLTEVLDRSDVISFASGTLLQKDNTPIEFSFFPIHGVVALEWVFDDGLNVSTLGVGRHGAVNAEPEIDLHSATARVTGQLPGSMWRIPALAWQKLLTENSALRMMLARYMNFMLTRSRQALACYMKHDVESRLCCWLLDLYDWQAGMPLTITHQGLARLLGVRRTTVTLMARSLQDAGIISYRRGRIEITDLYALQQASCVCHKSWRDWPAQWSSSPLAAVGE
jgi:CRP-like cAMP-binding protein